MHTVRLNTPCYVPLLTPSMCWYVCALRACVVVVAVLGRDVSILASERTGFSESSLVSHSVTLSLVVPFGGIRICVCNTL